MAQIGAIDVLGVLAASVAAFAVGAVWYGALGARWMAAAGRTEADLKAGSPSLPFVIAFLGALSASIAMAALMRLADLSGVLHGAALGMTLGAGVAGPWIILHYAFAGRPRDLWWIDGAHTLLALTAAGFVLGLFF